MLFSQTPPPQRRILTIFVDGASRGNPGASGIGILCKNAQGKAIIKTGFFTGNQTCNQAEYSALLYALYFLSTTLTSEQRKHYHLSVTADSLLLMNQMRGAWKIKDPTLKKLAEIIKELAQGFTFTFTHVLREFNTQADALANQGVDEKRIPPQEFLDLLEKHGVPLGL